MKIYWFSGTGNARSVTEWLAIAGHDHGLQVSLCNIGALKDRRHISPPQDTLLGFAGPTHGFNFPPVFLHFLLRFPRGKGQHVFMINTRAGMKMGKIFTPGLSGMALYLGALVLWLKGYKIQGLRSIDLPSNWISLHPGIRRKVVESIFRRRKADTLEFAEDILEGKRIYRGLWSLPLDLLITPVGILYYIIGRFAIAKTFYASRNCSRCMLCVEQCPVHAIRIVDGRCFWTHRCESCMQCMNNCPERAIETAHGFIIGFSILIISGILVWLNRLLHISAFIHSLLPAAISHRVVGLVDWFMYLAFIFLFYRIIHYLMRFRVVERLMVWTSLTRLASWRRYRADKKLREV